MVESCLDCERPAFARGLCGPHYKRRARRGELPELQRRSIAERLASLSQPTPTGCIEWVGFRDRDGYGAVMVNRRRVGAHRVAYELAHGEIPRGLEIDHRCKNRACINAGHLEAVTHAENNRRRTWRAA